MSNSPNTSPAKGIGAGLIVGVGTFGVVYGLVLEDPLSGKSLWALAIGVLAGFFMMALTYNKVAASVVCLLLVFATYFGAYKWTNSQANDKDDKADVAFEGPFEKRSGDEKPGDTTTTAVPTTQIQLPQRDRPTK